MDLELSETQTIFRDTLRDYLEREVPFSRVRELEKKGAADEALWQALLRQGWLGVACPEALGGGAGSLVDAGLLVEELQRRAVPVPIAEVLACLHTLLEGGGEPGREMATGVLAGESLLVPALHEAGPRLADVAARVGADGRLSGEKRFVDYASVASHHLVAARGQQGLGLYCVAAHDPAVRAEPLVSIGRTPQSRVRYDGAPAERVGDAEACRRLVQLGRTFCTVQTLACMQQALDMTVAYTSVREQFGHPIGTFQAVQHHAANMAIHAESVRFLAYEALDALQRGDASDEQVALAKAASAQAVPEVTMLAHQLHGGQGFIEENDLYFFTLRGKERGLAWGSLDECLAIVAETVERPARWL